MEKNIEGKSVRKVMSKDTAVEIIFGNEDLYKKYHRRIEIFLKELLKGEKLSKLHFEFQEKTEDEDFYFNDSSVLENGEAPSQKQPTYDKSFVEPLGVPEQEAPPEENKPQGFTCFNCLGNHHLKECPEEHDGARIANNKRDITQTVRYHTDDVLSFDSSSIRAGYISKELRMALDLKPNQLPFYIYNMRILGYPPGWMKDAEIETSGLAIYKSHESVPGVDSKKMPESKAGRYNGNKFVSFPGFNTPVPEGMIDEWKTLKMPPLQLHQQLSEALKHKMVTLSPECKKKKLPDEPAEKKRKENIITSTPIKKSVQQQNSLENHKTPDSKPKSVISGSPIIDNGNPYKRLPNIHNFSIGVSEFIPYENLPDAVGSYDQKLKNVLTDVREKMTKRLSDVM